MAFEIPLSDPNFAVELALLGATGSMSYAPLGTALPEGMQAYSSPIVNLGWMADDGLSEAIAEEQNSFTPWQAKGPIRTSVSTREFTFSATVWSLGGLANALRYGVPEDQMEWIEDEEYVEFTQGGEDHIEDYRFMLPIDVLDGEKHRRFILPEASVAERSDITYTKGDLTGYPFTFRANLSHEHGFSILRRFKEGWKPGTAGSMLTGSAESRSLGDWSTPVAETPGP